LKTVAAFVADERECFEYLACPACAHVDLDYELLEYRVVRCHNCGATVQVTGYKVFLGPPKTPVDHVGFIGEVVNPGTHDRFAESVARPSR
jgi:ribosomal protein S27E